MDQRAHDALSLMLDALLQLDDCQEYAAAAHLQLAIDALSRRQGGGGGPDDPVAGSDPTAH